MITLFFSIPASFFLLLDFFITQEKEITFNYLKSITFISKEANHITIHIDLS